MPAGESVKLRSYETRAVRQILRGFRSVKRQLAVAPTGSGKTVIGAALIQSRPKLRVLWLAHRWELLEQAIEQLVKAGVPRADIGLLSGKDSYNVNARVLVASIFMFRGHDVGKRDLVVVDEAHHAMAAGYRAVLKALPRAQVLGLTATPARLDGQPLGDVFEKLLIMAEAVDLIAGGYLARSRVYWIPKDKARELVKGLPPGGGDWSQQTLERAMGRHRLTKSIVAEWRRICPGKSTIVFAVSVKHAKQLCKRFNAAHAKAEVLSWETSKADRDAIMDRLRTGVTKVVVNVEVLTEGVDCPNVECIVLARPTKSLTLYRQMCGRGARPSSKRYIVLDEVGNAWRHGSPEAIVEWSLNTPPKIKGEVPMKVCTDEECRCAMPIAIMVCPDCGVEQPEPEEVVAKRRAELEEMRALESERKAARVRAEQIAKERSYPKRWVTDVMAEMFS